MIIDPHLIETAAAIQVEGDVLLSETRAGDHVLTAAREHYEMQTRESQLQYPVNEVLQRREDMGQGLLRVTIQEDGDVCLTVVDDQRRVAAIEFCTPFTGGGRSPKVREALLALAKAIQDENMESPQLT